MDGDCGVTLCYYYTCIGIADARAVEASIRKWVVEECYKKEGDPEGKRESCLRG